MKKFFFSFVLIFLLICILAGCDKKQNQDDFSNSESINDIDGDYDSWDTLLETNPADMSMNKIAAAQEVGKLDPEAASMLMVLADYNPDELPLEYAGEAGGSSQFAVRYLVHNWDSLSEETRQTVEPYIVLMDNPKSFLNPAYQKQGALSLPGYLPFCAVTPPKSDEIIKTEFTYDGQKVTIQYVQKKDWSKTDKKQMEDAVKLISEVIKYSWSKFKPYMQTSLTLPVKVEMVQKKWSSYGDEITLDDCHRIRLNHILVNKKENLMSTTAHELFHAFQDEYEIGFWGTEEKWFCEATATWSENYAYPDLNKEHMWLNNFFANFDRDRMGFDGQYEYAGYMLFYYLTHYRNCDFILDLTKLNGNKIGKGGNEVIRDYMNKHIPDLRDTYGEFALYNWNQGPMVKYDDKGPLKGSPTDNSLEEREMGPHEEDDKVVRLRPGAIKYYEYTFLGTPKELQHVRIQFDTPLTEGQVKRQAILKLNGKWMVEDWSDVTEKIFCRMEDQNLESLVLVYSKGDFTDTGETDADHFIVRTEDCYKNMEIKVTATFDYAVEDFTWHSETEFTEYLDIQKHSFFFVKEATYKFNGIGNMEGSDIIETSGSYSYTLDEIKDFKGFPRIVLNSTERIPGAKESYEKYGIKDNIPGSGMLMTVPALPEEGDIGTTTIYAPSPIGTVTVDTALLFDGLTQVGAIIPDIREWSIEGLSLKREINLMEYASPLASMYSADFGQLQDLLKSMQGMQNMPDIPDMPDIGDLGDFGSLDGLPEMPGMPDSGGSGGSDALSALSKLLSIMAAPQGAPGAVSTLKIKVEAIYVEEIIP